MIDPRDVQVEAWRGVAPAREVARVRVTHRPTGIAVECREHDSHGANREAALAELERRVAAARRGSRSA